MVHIFKNNNELRQPGIEPGPRAWKARILTIELLTLIYLFLNIIYKINKSFKIFQKK